MASDDPRFRQLQVPARWVGTDETPILVANQLIVQAFQGNVLLTFGQVAPPPLAGSPEEQAQQMSEIEALAIHALARFTIPPGPFREMMKAFESAVAALDRDKGADDVAPDDDGEPDP